MGFIANGQNNCDTPDSFVGIGTQHLARRNSAGKYADSNTDNGPVNIRAIGYIMTR